jgi:hypothetical protein
VEITWVCDACGEEVGADGQVLVRTSEQQRWRREHRSYQEQTRGKSVLSGDDVGAYPSVCRWQVLHSSCDPDPDDVRYWIATGTIGSFRQVVHWTSHLLAKRWVAEETDWAALLGRLSATGSNRA